MTSSADTTALLVMDVQLGIVEHFVKTVKQAD